MAVKDAVKGRFQLHRMVSGLLTLVFMFVTAGWLFLAQPLRNGMDIKVINESSILLKIFKSN
ncbi:putative long-chain-alcohol O-fatty-acyltransferase [Helianthus debilis subsp. tardiflorus]